MPSTETPAAREHEPHPSLAHSPPDSRGPSLPEAASLPPLDVAETFAGKRILFIGATGFVGKVALSMFLRRYPGIGKMFVLVRPGAGSSAEDRFFRKIAASPTFDPIREVWGAGFDAFLREKVVPLPGDASRANLNFSDADIAAMAPLDAIINCAGLVTFDPTLESALRINAYGVQNTLAVARRTGAAVVHVSTCFVAGNRDGEIWEDEEVLGYYPRAARYHDPNQKDALLDEDFGVRSEIADCERAIEQIKSRADDRMHVSMFRERGSKRLRAEGRDETDEKNLKIAVQRERKMFLATELQALGMERAKHWGWTNTYTYTKSLGEQLCVEADRATGEDHVRCCIVRPAIVESAMSYPMRGWNEGFTTTAPIAMLSLVGHTQFPIGEWTGLDLIPVDLVSAGIIAATAATIARRNALVYQLASGDLNPQPISRALGLLGLYKRRYYQNREASGTIPKFLNALKARIEPVRVSPERWRWASAPRFRRVAEGLMEGIDKWTPKWGAPRVQGWAEHAREALSDVSQLMAKTEGAFELFMPFIHDRDYVFRCDQTRALFASLTDADRAALPWNPEQIDWREYWLDIHMPGLEKWVFPSLEEEFQAKPKPVYSYKDLLELFDATTKHHRQRTAMRQLPPVDKDGDLLGEPQRYTYGDLQDLAQRVATALYQRGVAAGDKVMLVSENRPEWGITYFGVLKCGASVVPVDGNATADEVRNLLASSRAKVAVISERSMARLEGEGLAESMLPAPRVDFPALFDVPAREVSHSLTLLPKAKGDDLASLIFTSGTTGRPKGVMLSHRNFASLLSKLAGVFDIDKHDGLLSVLPLHHTFEFTAGLLMPLMRGAHITYLDEVSAEGLTAAFEDGHVTGMVGVPALWQLLHRRITRPVADRGPLVESVFEAVVEWMRKLSDALPQGLGFLNIPKLLFLPVHQRFGGRLRLMIPGGSALPVETMKAFRGLGFHLYEGYGLTEASPVLAVTRPGTKLLPGSVGEALPGIEIRIHEPDATGVGEVIASGPNVMMGYFEDEEATSATIQKGWLHTGDLGRIDEEGRLFIVGRKKEMILGASGENVYPDELEELYRDSQYVKELSVVGLPQAGGGELVAALVVPDYERAGDLGREETRDQVREHFRAVSAKLPQYKRVKVLHLTDVELPKTATRKVKRRAVVEEMQRLEHLKQKGDAVRAERLAQSAAAAAAAGGGADRAGGLDGSFVRQLLAEVAHVPFERVQGAARLDELGFDSLMYTELGVALDAAGVALPEQVDSTGVGTVEELAKLVASWGEKRGKKEAKKPRKNQPAPGEAEEIVVPRFVTELGTRALDLGQRMLYERYLKTTVTGKAYLPSTKHFIVAANHASHLDMGLVKHALGEWANRVVALAAKDYFFDDPLKRAYFENFTNLVPMERHGSLRESLRLAQAVIRDGYVLLIFPEGTRSTTGTMVDFKALIGYLALQGKVDVLPVYLEGTFGAMPKGATLPTRGHRIAAHIGPVLSYESLKAVTEGLPRTEHYRATARVVEAAVRRLAPRGHVDRIMPGSDEAERLAAKKGEARVLPRGHHHAPDEAGGGEA